jgi:hypothetical protein
VAAIAMLLHKSYGDVMEVVRTVCPNADKIKRNGLNLSETEQVAAYFGVNLVRRYRMANDAHLIGATGILGLLSPKMHKAGHWVVLKNGTTIVDPDGAEVWDTDEYLKHWNARSCTLLVREG